MNWKTLLTAKTFWTGIAMIGLGVVQIFHGNTDGGIQTIGQGAGLIFLRNAVATAK
jgi:hypothetical protein